jgi:hypothetical protein
MDEPNEEQIVAALEDSGYLFEQDVATYLESKDFHVETSWAYLDVEQQKSREIDVRAIREVAKDETNKIQIFVELLVECKAFDSPLVFIERLKNQRELMNAAPGEYVFPIRRYEKKLTGNSYQEVDPFVHLKLRDKHYYFRETMKATQFSKIVRKGKEWVANHEGIYDSLILPMAKLLDFRKEEVLKFSRGPDWKIVWLFFPMVVLRDHLFSYNPSVAEKKLEKRGRVTFVRHLESDNLKGFYMTDFLTFDYLEQYIQKDVAEFSGAIVDILSSNPRALLDKQA